MCELVCLLPDGTEASGARDARGNGRDTSGAAREGFGYDPVFVPDGETQTVAELGNEWKAQNSHRARAAHLLREALESVLDPGA